MMETDIYVWFLYFCPVVEQRSQVEASLNNRQIRDNPGVDSDPLQHLMEAIITDEDGFINLRRARAGM